MFNQHAKWLKVSREIPWRRPIASLNYLLTSHVWRQDHNGFSHQDPVSSITSVNKKAGIIRVYLPPDPTRCFARRPMPAIAASRQCDRRRKHRELQFLDMDSAVKHARLAPVFGMRANDHDGDLTS